RAGGGRLGAARHGHRPRPRQRGRRHRLHVSRASGRGTREAAGAEGRGRGAWSVTLDQTDADAIPGAVDAAAAHFGRLDGLVNNAGWNISIPFPDLAALDAGTWDRLFSTNLRGPDLLGRAAGPPSHANGA